MSATRPRLSPEAMQRKREYDKEYARNNFKGKYITFSVSNPKDMEIYNWMVSQENAVRYIKDLIAEDMEKKRKENV